MRYWIFLFLIGVFSTKFYTSIQLRKRDRRFDKAREDLQLTQWTLKAAHEKQRDLQAEADLWQDRDNRMREVIEDLWTRLSVQGDIP